MQRRILICGLLGGLLITLLKWSEYHFLVIEHSVQIYTGLTAAIFAGLGVWIGIKLSGPSRKVTATETAVTPLLRDGRKRNKLGLTPRELEILELIAQGMSNREIAGKLFVSENTIKTHCSRTFDKLGARRRTQAVQLGKELGLLP